MQGPVGDLKGNMTVEAYQEALGDIDSYSSLSMTIIVE